MILTSETAFSLLKLLGAAYLIYLGVRQWRSATTPLTGPESKTVSPHRRRATEGFSVALSNPKVILFFMAFLPQFIDTQQPLPGQFLILALTFAVVEFAVELMLAISAMKVLHWFNDQRGMRFFNRLTGGLFIGARALILSSQR